MLRQWFPDEQRCSCIPIAIPSQNEQNYTRLSELKYFIQKWHVVTSDSDLSHGQFIREQFFLFLFFFSFFLFEFRETNTLSLLHFARSPMTIFEATSKKGSGDSWFDILVGETIPIMSWFIRWYFLVRRNNCQRDRAFSFLKIKKKKYNSRITRWIWGLKLVTC